MRVIRHESGWDIGLDMVFTDKRTAVIVADRIRHAVRALVRDAVDPSMRHSTENTGGRPLAKASTQTQASL